MSDGLDRALQHYRFLRRIVDERAERAARGQVSWDTYENIGVIGQKEKADKARELAAIFHDELSKMLDQVGFLGVVAAFEAEMGNRIRNAIGLARNAVRDGYPPTSVLSKQALGLLRGTSSFESIKAIEELVEGHLAATDRSALRVIRDERNRLAHGSFDQPVKVSPEQAHQVLGSILSETGPQ